MDPEKAEFKRLIDLMGWSQSEAARKLYKTPAAVNHLVNPDHPNKPTQTTLQLLKWIIASERPELFETAFELKEGPPSKNDPGRLNAKERGLIEMLRQAAPEEQEKIYAVIKAMLNRGGGKQSKGKKSGGS